MTAELLDSAEVGRLYEGGSDVYALEEALRSLLLAKDEGRLSGIARNARGIVSEMEWRTPSKVLLGR